MIRYANWQKNILKNRLSEQKQNGNSIDGKKLLCYADSCISRYEYSVKNPYIEDFSHANLRLRLKVCRFEKGMDIL